MTVTFSVTGLTKAATAALTQHDKTQAEYVKACDVYRKKHADEHGPQSRSRAVGLRDELTKALKKTGPVTIDSLPSISNRSYVSDLFYKGVDSYSVKKNVTQPAGLLSPAEVAETKALVAVLKAATGDTISANELKLLGLKNLAPIFIAAGAAG